MTYSKVTEWSVRWENFRRQSCRSRAVRFESNLTPYLAFICSNYTTPRSVIQISMIIAHLVIKDFKRARILPRDHNCTGASCKMDVKIESTSNSEKRCKNVRYVQTKKTQFFEMRMSWLSSSAKLIMKYHRLNTEQSHSSTLAQCSNFDQLMNRTTLLSRAYVRYIKANTMKYTLWCILLQSHQSFSK